MKLKFSSSLDTVLTRAIDEAMRTGHSAIGVDHLTLALLRRPDDEACRALSALGVALGDLKGYIDAGIFREKAVPYAEYEGIRPSRAAGEVISAAAYEALKTGTTEIGTRHLLLAISRSGGNRSAEYLASMSIGHAELQARLGEKKTLPHAEGESPVRMREILGALGEQLTKLYGPESASGKTYS